MPASGDDAIPALALRTYFVDTWIDTGVMLDLAPTLGIVSARHKLPAARVNLPAFVRALRMYELHVATRQELSMPAQAPRLSALYPGEEQALRRLDCSRLRAEDMALLARTNGDIFPAPGRRAG